MKAGFLLNCSVSQPKTMTCRWEPFAAVLLKTRVVCFDSHASDIRRRAISGPRVHARSDVHGLGAHSFACQKTPGGAGAPDVYLSECVCVYMAVNSLPIMIRASTCIACAVESLADARVHACVHGAVTRLLARLSAKEGDVTLHGPYEPLRCCCHRGESVSWYRFSKMRLGLIGSLVGDVGDLPSAGAR